MTESEEPAFRPIGSLIKLPSTTPPAKGSMPTSRPRGSEISGRPSPAPAGSSSTGLQHGETGASLQPIEQLRETATAPETDRSLEASLRRLLGQSKSLVDDGSIGSHGYEARWVLKNVPADLAPRAHEMINAACTPAKAETAVRELTKLRYKTISRSEGDEDMQMRLIAYAEELAEFPADVIRSACQSAARCEKFFPSVSELRSECQRAMRFRDTLRHSLRVEMYQRRK